LEILNSFELFVACSLSVLLVVFITVLYLRRAMTTAIQMGFTKQQVSKAVRAGSISAVGPSCAVGIGVVGLIALIGGPYGWMRLSVVGSLQYETINAQMMAQKMGSTLGSLTAEQMTTIAWGLTLSVFVYQTNVLLFAPSYAKVMRKVSAGDPRLLGILAICAIIGVFSRGAVGYYFGGTIGLDGWSCLVGMIASVIMIEIIGKRLKVGWAFEWTLPVAMISGMIAAIIIM